MKQLVALTSVIGWAVFWTFGGLALLAPATDASTVPAVLVAFAGMLAGSYSFLWLRVRPYASLQRAR
jgi:hypothetical protein